MRIKQMYLSLGKLARGDPKDTSKPLYFPTGRYNTDRKLEKIIIHWVGPFPHHTPEGVRQWWENGSDGLGVRASAHYIIKDENVIQTLPLEEIGRHSGDERNYYSIGVEVVPMNVAGEFSRQSISSLKELTRRIRFETGLDLKLERHFDGTQKKDCPRFYTPVVSLLDGGGRTANPEGGNSRWEELKRFINGE